MIKIIGSLLGNSRVFIFLSLLFLCLASHSNAQEVKKSNTKG